MTITTALRRSALIGIGLALAGSVAPASAQSAPPASGCSASTTFTISTLLPAAAPQCSFVTVVTGFRVVSLNVNGTGQVSASMSVTSLINQAHFAQVSFVDGGEATQSATAAPACGPAQFRCSTGTNVTETATGVIVSPVLTAVDPDGSAVVRVTCTGGGLAINQSVSCSVGG